MIPVIKAHAYGNDFLYAEEDAAVGWKAADLARAACDRHAGIGADGLILYRRTVGGASMRLLNADGSYSEVSGNGVRGLAAVLLDVHGVPPSGRVFTIATDAGEKRLEFLGRDAGRPVFRAAMGAPTEPSEVTLDIDGERLRVAAFRVGNPQCVQLVRDLDEVWMRRFGPRLEHHPHFPEGTNVEFVQVESPDRVRILIWERGVGPTLASGTGACASAVAAAAFGGASRDVQVTAPGGTQRVEWRDDGLFLTGWAQVIAAGTWLAVPARD
jgi:diaminopimelate epimerase